MGKYYYKMKPEIYEFIKGNKNITNRKICKTVGLADSTMSQILNGEKLNIRKLTAYAITKYLNYDWEIPDVFDIIEKK